MFSKLIGREFKTFEQILKEKQETKKSRTQRQQSVFNNKENVFVPIENYREGENLFKTKSKKPFLPKFKKAIASVVIIIFIALSVVSLAGCGDSKLYTYKELPNGSYEIVEVTDGSEGMTVGNIEKALEEKYGIDYKQVKSEDGTIYIVPNYTAIVEKQADLSKILSATDITSHMFYNDSNNYLEDSKCTDIIKNCANQFLSNRKLTNYKYCDVYGNSPLIYPIYANGKINFFFDAKNQETGEVALFHVYVDVNTENQKSIDNLLTLANTGNKEAYTLAFLAVNILASESETYQKSDDLNPKFIYEYTCVLNSYEYRNLNTNGFQSYGSKGKLVLYNGEFCIINNGEINDKQCDLLLRVDPCIDWNNYNEDTVTFNKDENNMPINPVNLGDNPFSKFSRENYCVLFGLVK